MIDLSLINFSLLIGSFDAADYLNEFSLSVPSSEIGQPLVYTANFEVGLNDKAYKAGLTEADFSEVSTPLRWREAQAQVKLIFTVNGVNYPFPVLRIKDYRYNVQTKKGSGTLTQLFDLMTFDRQAALIPDTEFGANTDFNTVVKNLLIAAGNVNGDQIIDPANIYVSGLQGNLDVKLTSKDPLVDAQKLAGLNWQWLYIDSLEAIRLLDRPETGTPLFSRSFNEVDLTPKQDNIHFASNLVVVTGSYQQTKLPDLVETANPDQITDSKGRPKLVKTETIAPIGEIFSDERPGDVTQITTDVKSIFYRYADNLRSEFNGNLYFNMTDAALAATIDYPTILSTSETDTIQTITVTETLVGKVFKDDKPDTATALDTPTSPTTPTVASNTTNTITNPANFTNIDPKLLGYIVSSLTIETEKRKYSFVPYGVKFPDQTVTFFQRIALTLDRMEAVRSPLIIQGLSGSTIDPRTGKAQRFEVKPTPEETFTAPDYNLETITVKGQYELTPSTYTTFLPKRNLINVDFLPGQYFADLLARKFAIREMGRRESYEAIMQLPVEWMANGFKPFAIADLGNVRVLMENSQITLTNQSMVFSFIAEKIGDIIAVAPPLPPSPYIPVEGLHIASSSGLLAQVGVTIPPLALVASGGTPPYTFSGSLPTGLNLSVLGLITGTPTVIN